MMFQIAAAGQAKHGGMARKVTCLTCNLKKCLGRCRWESTGVPESPRSKRA